MKSIDIVYLLFLCGCICATSTEVTPEPNVLKKVWDIWNNWRKPNEFIPDIILDTLQIIKKAGYPAEAHVITTEDGYLLTLHRIPGGNRSLPVLLQHGLLVSSADWVMLGKGKSLAFLLADQGYDVWLGNFRGNTYSKAHVSLSPSNSTFWDFSFEEMGTYDLSAMITFITNMRSQPLHAYIGHSMGTTTFYIMAIKRPEIVPMVKIMISLAPTAFVNNMKSPLRYFIPVWKYVTKFMQYFTHGEFLRSNFVRFFTKYGCQQYLTKKICINAIFLITGYDYEQFNSTLQPVILAHDPAGTSIKTMTHYIQLIQTGKFRQYDYGSEKNLIMYDSVEPPAYDLAKMTVPVALLYSDNDWLISVEDVNKLYNLLPNVIDMYKVPWSSFNHIDFIWANDAPKLVYERIFEIMKRKKLNNVKSVKQREDIDIQTK